jgi:hypothetical protein
MSFFEALVALRRAVRASPDHRLARTEALVAAQDAESIARFVRDTFTVYPAAASLILGIALTVILLVQSPQPIIAEPLSPATAANTLYLSGSSYLQVPNTPALHPSGGLTVEAWARPLSTSGCQTIVGKGYQTGFWLGICEGKLRFYSNGSASFSVSPEPSTVIGQPAGPTAAGGAE